MLASPAFDASAAANDAYFIQQRVALPSTPPKAPRGGATPFVIKLQSATDIITRTDAADGTNLKNLWQTEASIRAMSVSGDGSRICCLVEGVPDSTPSGAPGRSDPRLMLLRSDGSVIKPIDLGPLNVRVFGAPVFADPQHIGLTVCSISAAPAPARPVLPPPRSAQPAPGELERLASQRAAGQRQWELGQFPSQPFIATIDLEGHNLKRLAPGAMPCWSPDGKTILYTELKIEETTAAAAGGAAGPAPATQPSLHYRLMVMDAGGQSPRAVAPEHSCDGCFSPDGGRIAYIANIADHKSDLIIADADGSNAHAVSTAAASLYASPRWIDGGKRLEFVSFSPPPKGRDMRVNQLNCIWSIALNGSAAPAQQLSPPLTNFVHGCAIDADAETWIFHRAFPLPKYARPSEGLLPPPQPNQPRLPGVPADFGEPKPIPDGVTIESFGTKVYFRDASGNRKPVPDGVYVLPNGMLMTVRGGERTQN
jgi:hypothetical protein